MKNLSAEFGILHFKWAKAFEESQKRAHELLPWLCLSLEQELGKLGKGAPRIYNWEHEQGIVVSFLIPNFPLRLAITIAFDHSGNPIFQVQKLNGSFACAHCTGSFADQSALEAWLAETFTGWSTQ